MTNRLVCSSTPWKCLQHYLVENHVLQQCPTYRISLLQSWNRPQKTLQNPSFGSNFLGVGHTAGWISFFVFIFHSIDSWHLYLPRTHDLNLPRWPTTPFLSQVSSDALEVSNFKEAISSQANDWVPHLHRATFRKSSPLTRYPSLEDESFTTSSFGSSAVASNQGNNTNWETAQSLLLVTICYE